MEQEQARSLEYRMYTLTPYNLSGIQKGIQSLHGVVEYHLLYGEDIEYLDWAKNWKTVIVLNGGTSNNSGSHMYENHVNNSNHVPFYGTMEQHADVLTTANIKYATFFEPDANNMLTAIAFLCDERVFKTRPRVIDDIYYPHFEEWLRDFKKMVIARTGVEPRIEYHKEYEEWVEFVGGPVNVFLRDFTSKFGLASN
jgi:hypothetical protein